MRAGRLRHKITIQQTTESVDAIGGKSDSWATYKTAWAHVEPMTMKGKETFQSGTVYSEITHIFHIRYIAGITTKMRISWDSRTFNILSVSNVNELNKNMDLMCLEVVN